VVEKGRETRISWRDGFFLPLAVSAVVFALFTAKSAQGALINGSYEIRWDQDVSKTETETTDVRKFRQTVDLQYKGFLSSQVQNAVTFKFEQEIISNAADTTRFLPTLDLFFKGKFWEATAGGKRTQENSDEPGKTPKITDDFFVEIFYLPPINVPDMKAKYTLRTDEEEGVTDTADQEITLSSVYKPIDWLNVKGDYSLRLGENKLQPDSDTEDEEISGTIGLRHFVSRNIKVLVEYDVDVSRSETLLDAGGTSSSTETQTHTVKSTLGFRPFRDTNFDGSYDFTLKRDKVSGEDMSTKTGKVSLSQRIWELFDVKGEFQQDINEDKNTDDDNIRTEDRVLFDLGARFSKHLDFTFSYQRTDTDEDHKDPTKNTTSGSRITDATWTGELTPFWKASATYSETETLEKDIITTVDTSYNLESTIDFKGINLTLDPSYTVTEKSDKVAGRSTETRDFNFSFAWKMFQTRNMEAKIDHTYGRKTDTDAGNIQRTDSSLFALTWNEPFPGWTFAIDLTRSATDTSEDDLEPDITSTFGFKSDYKYEMLTMATSYRYDKKSAAANSWNFDLKLGWTAPDWNAALTYSFDKTLSAELDEGYSISLVFKYNI
jgi:predicted porin